MPTTTILTGSASPKKANPCAKCGGTERRKNGNCKPCDVARNRAYRVANREALDAKKRIYIANNREAVAASKRAWCEANREKVAASARQRHAQRDPVEQAAKRRAWHETNRDKVRAELRERSTGWSREAFDTAWEKQVGRCAICAVDMERHGRGPRSVAADHCHATKRTRGLLCSHCNRAIGMLGDSPENARAAAAYLEAHR